MVRTKRAWLRQRKIKDFPEPDIFSPTSRAQKKKAFLPSFSLSAQAGKDYDRDHRLSSWSEFRRADSSAQANGEWNLFNSGKDVLNYKSASLQWQIARIDYGRAY